MNVTFSYSGCPSGFLMSFSFCMLFTALFLCTMLDSAPTISGGTATFGPFRYASASLQDTCRNTGEMYTEYGQKAPSVSECVSNVEHK